MSELNGDKARFGRLRKQKLARREAVRELRTRVLQTQQAKPAQESVYARPVMPSSTV
jgi:hypothetical protein